MDLYAVAIVLDTTIEYLLTGKELPKSYDDPIKAKICKFIESLDHDHLIAIEAVMTFYNGLTLQPDLIPRLRLAEN